MFARTEWSATAPGLLLRAEQNLPQQPPGYEDLAGQGERRPLFLLFSSFFLYLPTPRISLQLSAMSSVSSTSIARPKLAYSPPQVAGSSSAASTSRHENGEYHIPVVVEALENHHAIKPASSRKWLPWSPLRPEPKLTPCSLTPDELYEVQVKRQVRRKAAHLTLSSLALIGSSTGEAITVFAVTSPNIALMLLSILSRAGAGWCISFMRDKPSAATTDTPTTIEGLLDPIRTQSTEDGFSANISTYLSAVFFLLILASFVFTVSSGCQLALILHNHRIKNLDDEKRTEDSRTWKRLNTFFGSKSTEIKKPQLPTYGHAVRQAVLKHTARQGDIFTEFNSISAEEMELERFRKLGGAPPGKFQLSPVQA